MSTTRKSPPEEKVRKTSLGELLKIARAKQDYGKDTIPLRGVLLNMKQGGLPYEDAVSSTDPVPLDVDLQRAEAGTLNAGVVIKARVTRSREDESKSKLAVEDAGPLDFHQRVLEGIATKDLLVMLDYFDAIPKHELLSAIGVSERTLQRHRDGRLGSDVASVALDLATITEQAQNVLGSMAEAQRWLTMGAVALKSRRPLDLLSTRQGAELVRDLLVSMEYGVYA